MKSIAQYFFLPVFLSGLFLSSCSNSITGDDLEVAKIERCQEVILDQFSLYAPCTWTIVEMHPENSQIGILYTGESEIYFTGFQVPSLASIADEKETYFYPVLDGRVIFVDEVLQGQSIVAVYFESTELEGFARTYKFWYNPRFDSEDLRNFLLSIQLR